MVATFQDEVCEKEKCFKKMDAFNASGGN